MDPLTHLSLFSGIGGLDLAAEWAGIKTVGQCEFADYPTKVLEKHWPEVPRWRDIRTLTKDTFYEKTKLRTVDIISGGFPCQPFSVAGKHGGVSDDRFLWPEMLRVISELRPAWVVGENVPGIINMALEKVLSDLENIEYQTQAIIIPACAVGAWHKRERVAILAYRAGERNGVDGPPENAPEACGYGDDHKRRASPNDTRERGPTQSGVDRVVSRLLHSLDWPTPDSGSEILQRQLSEEICGGGHITSTI